MLAQIVDHILFGGGGKSAHWCQVGRMVFANITGDIQVVGTEIMPPARQAMRFVKHPAADLALADGIAKRRVTELLRRHQQNADIAQAQFVEHVLALRHRQHAVEGGRAEHAGGVQIVYLVLHQRLQRRHHYSQAAITPVARNGGQLVADGLAAAGRQDRQQRLPGIAGTHDSLLQRTAIRC